MSNLRPMDTTTGAPSRRHHIIAALFATAVMAVYVWSVWDLYTADWGSIDWPGLLLGLALIFLPRGLRGILLGLGVIVAVEWLASDRFNDWFGNGIDIWFALGITLVVVVGMRRAWRTAGAQLGNITLEDLTDDAPAPAAAARRLIGLTGYAGAGKDTAAKGLLKQGWVRVSFAAKLKEFAYALDVHDCYGRSVQGMVDAYGWDELKYNDDWYRAFLQRVGTDCGRRILGENVWVDAVMSDLPDADVVVTDTRFPNEAQAIKDAGGHVLRITRPGVAPVNGHVSETALDGFPVDGIVSNDGDMLTVGARLAYAARVLGGR